MIFTDDQKAVIEAKEPYLLVSACPGAGKSAVLLARICQIIRDGVLPARIVVITFTNSAAKVLTDRLAVLAPGTALQFVGTLHGFLLRLLTAHGSLIGLPPNVSVVDADEEKSLLADALEEVAYRGTYREVESEVAKGPSPRLNPMTKAGLAAEAFFQRLRSDGILTYDMILHYGERLLKAMATKGKSVEADHLLVDEAADLTEQDGRIIASTGIPNIWICGDFDQSIFGWRSGDKTNWFENCCKMATCY